MKNSKILLSFVGTNDAGKLLEKPDGAILTALKNEKFDIVYLLWNKGSSNKISYQEISEYLKKEIKKRKLAQKIFINELHIKNVTDHNRIYVTLKDFTDNLPKSEELEYKAAISSGTPAMQVCWILLAESGDFSENYPLRLIQVKDPKFGKSENIPVKIDTSLPRIVRMKEEVAELKKDLLPVAKITIAKPGLFIGEKEIPLAPIELSYYRYFADRVISDKGLEKFSGFNTTIAFLKRINEIHAEFFPDLDSNRMELEKFIKDEMGISLSTFRGNVSKINKKLKNAIDKDAVLESFQINVEGQRGAKFYGIKAPKEKIEIVI